jgi:hypothetical protein
MAREINALTGGVPLPKQEWMFDGFNLGNNTFALATELKGQELAQMTNVELYGKRSVRPRRGGESLGNAVGSGAIDGLFQYKEGTSINQILALTAGILQKYNSTTGAWDDITGATFTSGLRTRSTKMQSYGYLGNGIDDFTRYNGTILEQFSAVAAPTGLAVAQQGTTGATAYEYTVTTVTAKGDSLPATNVAITNGNAILTSTNKVNVTFNRRTESQVIGYNVYGRSQRGKGVTLMLYIEQPTSGATVTFADDGTVTPQVWLPPEGDSTDGIKASIWEQLRGALIAAGDPVSPSRMYYSGTGDKYESFSPAHNGGWVDVRPGDNDAGINGLAPFESKIIVGKERSIHQFQFSPTTGDAVIQELITYVGVGAPGSMVVMENDCAFVDSEGRFRILGYEPNFGSSIRTTSLSEGRVQSLFDDVDPNYLKNIEAVYFNGQYIMAYTPAGATVNKKVIRYDRRYLSFLGTADGADAHVRCWLVWDGKDKKQRLFAGSSDDGTVFEWGVEGILTNHDGTTVVPVIRTRNEDGGNSGQSKLFKWADLRIFRISGTLKLKTIINGATVIDEKSFSSRTSTGWGIARWGTIRWGVPTGIGASSSNIDRTYRKELYEIGNSLQFEITKEGAQDDFVLVSMRGEMLLLPTEVFDSDFVI